MRKSKCESETGIQTIRDLIDHRADTQPDVDFLIGPETGRILTFRGLQEQSRFVSIQLQQLRLERGDKIAFLMDNGLFTAQLFLGAMYGGFVSVPLNVRAGVSQLSYTLDHCDAKVVFVEEKYTGLIKEVLVSVRRAVRVIPAEVDCFIAECAAPPPIAPPLIPASEDAALLMYTSGSTGQPKAAVHSHRTILAQAKEFCRFTSTRFDRSLTPRAATLPYQRGVCHIDSLTIERRFRRRASSLCCQAILGLDGRTPLHVVGVGADNYIATSGLERSSRGQS